MNELGLSSVIVQYGGNLAVVIVFIYYLNKRDDKFQRALDKLSDAIEALRTEINDLKRGGI
jgi:cell division protein FtsB